MDQESFSWSVEYRRFHAVGNRPVARTHRKRRRSGFGLLEKWA